MSNYTKAGEMFVCPYCGAAIGVACTTTHTIAGSNQLPGQRARYQHEGRWRLVRQVLELTGYIDETDRLRNMADDMWRRAGRAVESIDRAGDGVWIEKAWARNQLAKIRDMR